MTQNNDICIVIFEDQQYPIPRPIAEDDEKLRALLSPFAPAAASAKIERTPGQPIRLLKQSGPKGGSSPLDILRDEPESYNPAVLMARQIQHLEINGGISVEQMEAWSQEIETAIQDGSRAIADYNITLDTLKFLPASPGKLPIGF